MLFSADNPFVVPDAESDNELTNTAYDFSVSEQILGSISHDQSTATSGDVQSNSHLVIVDRDVENYAAIKEAIESRTDGQWTVHILDNTADPIGAISTTIAGHTNLTALHLITHGRDGELKFSGQTINTQSLLLQADEISSWNDALATDAEILVYGCDVAATEDGKAMIESLAHLTGVDVAASSDTTGHAADNGDWELEYRTGSIDASSALNDFVQDQFVSTLGDFFVTTTNETGPGSLAQAISDLNGSTGNNTITFQVAGTFTINSQLTEFRETVIIDGTQVPGYSGTPLVLIRGEFANPSPGLQFTGNSDSSVLRGIAITGFQGHGIVVNNVDNIVIEDNYIGTTGPIDSGVFGDGIRINNSNFSTFQNNVIADNFGTGINHISGGNIKISDNIIRDNNGNGVIISDSASVDNTILGNTIYNNNGIQIDIGNPGPNANDTGVQDADTGANNLQNKPEITNVTTNQLDTVNISFSLDSEATTDYRIEFFSGASSLDAENFLGAVELSTDAGGLLSSSIVLTQFLAAGQVVTATATDINGPSDYESTSEFSDGFTANMDNTPPAITSPAAQSLDENTTNVATLLVSDPDPDTHTFSIIGGADASLFNVGASSGALSFITAPDKESPGDKTYEVEVQVSDGSVTTSKMFFVDVNDVDEFVISFPADQDSTDDEVAEYASIGDTVGITATSTDNDATATVTYTLSNDAGGLFSIDANGVVRVAGALDAETATSHLVTVRATSDGFLFKDTDFTITVLDDDEFPISPVTDNDLANDSVVENASVGSLVGVTALATDPDVDDSVSYSLTNDAGGRFAIDSDTGVVSVAAALDAESNQTHTISIQASSSGGGTSTIDILITVTDANEFFISNQTDIDSDPDQTAENSAIGDTVGITVFANDADISDTVSYTLTDDASGRFTIDAGGVIRVAAALDAETDLNHTITARATSTDGSFAESNVVIAIQDVDEFPLSAVSDTDSAANFAFENVAPGTSVGIDAHATDFDIDDTISFALTNDAGGLFSINAFTGVVTVANTLDAETSISHMITVQATSTKSGSTSTDFLIDIYDVNEALVSTPDDQDAAIDQVAENSVVGDSVGVTVLATDDDISDTVSYSLTDDAGGRFSIDAGGVIRVAAALDAETDFSHTVTARAMSSDGSFEENNFTISVLDTDEFAPSAITDTDTAANQVNENATIGTTVGIDANSTDLDRDDTISYSLTDDAGGLFSIDAVTGVVSVAGALDAESSASHSISVQATSTRSGFTGTTFLINVDDVNESAVSTPIDQDATNDQVAENAAIGDTTGLTISANDADISDTVSYSLSNDAGGRFTIDAGGVIRVAAALDAETDLDHTVTARANSSDGSFTESNFVIAVQDVDEFALSVVSDTNVNVNLVNENAALGTTVGIDANATDPDRDDAVSYSLTNDAGGLFAIDTVTGIVTVAGTLDAEASASHTITVQATSTRSGSTNADFLVNVANVNESSVTPPVDQDVTIDQVAENASAGETVGITVYATDPDISDTVSYSLTDDADGRFTIDAGGVIRVAGVLDAETNQNHTVIARVTSTDGSFATINFVINATDANEFSVTLPIDLDVGVDQVAENAAIGDTTGLTISANDADITDTISYSLTDNAGGRFSIDAAGVIRVATGLDAESNSSHSITARATSTDGSFAENNFVIAVQDIDEFGLSAVTDTSPAANQVNENASLGATVGIDANATDPDRDDTVSYALTDDAGGRFTIDAVTGIVTVAGIFDAETSTDHTITIQASSTRSGTTSANLLIYVVDVNESMISTPIDQDMTINQVAENAAIGETTGLTISANDADVSDTVSYSLIDDAGGRFTIDAGGVIRVAAALDAEANDSHTIVARATSSDGSVATNNFSINVTDINESSVSAPIDQDINPESVVETAAIGDAAGFAAMATDSDITDTVSYSLSNDAGGLFSIDGNGIVRVSGVLDAESAGSHLITVQASSTDGSTASQDVTITVVDVNEFPISGVIDSDAANNTLVENAAIGTNVGIQALATDADLSGDISYALTDDAGGRFTIDSTTGVISLLGSVDAEISQQHTITVQAISTNGDTSASNFTITVSDINESSVSEPVDIDTAPDTVNEHVAIGSSVGIRANAADADITDTVSYTLTDGSGLFAIDASGRIYVTGELDAEIANQHFVEVSALSTDGSSTSTTFEILVNDINDQSPTIIPGQEHTLFENQIGPMPIANIAAIDGDTFGSLNNWQIDTGNEDALFEIDQTSGSLYLASGQSADFETQSLYQLGVSVSDGVNRSTVESVVIRIVDVDEVPSAGADLMTTGEDSPLSIVIASDLMGNDTDPEGGTLSVTTFTQGQHGTVESNGNGEIIYSPESNFHGTDQFQYTVTDESGNSAVGHVEIIVTAINDLPELVIATTITINENSETVNASIQASDIDGDTLIFSLSGEDAAQFIIDEQTGDIRFVESADFENPADADLDNQYNLDVIVSDTAGGSRSEFLSVEVQNTNDLPTATADLTGTLDGNPGLLGSIDVQDQDLGDSHTFEIVASNAADAVQIDDQGQIEQISEMSPGIYFLDVLVRDQTGSEVVLSLEFQVTDPNAVDIGAANPDNIINNTDDALSNALSQSQGSSTGSNSNTSSTMSGGSTGSNGAESTYANTESAYGNSDSAYGHAPTNTSGNLTIASEQSPQAKRSHQVRNVLDEAVSEINMIDSDSFSKLPPSAAERNNGSTSTDSRGSQFVLDLLVDGPGDQEKDADTLSASFESLFPNLELSPQLMNALKSMNEKLEKQSEQAQQSKELIVTSVTVVTGTLSVGLVTWLLNSGSLMATALTTSPLWRSIDPIPVLANRDHQDRRASR